MIHNYISRITTLAKLSALRNLVVILVKRTHDISCAHNAITRCVIEMCHITCHITNDYILVRQHNLLIS
jgi:hypothetical protein